MTRAALAAAGFVQHEIDGTVYFTAGEGDSLVLVHGVNDHAGSWFLVAPTLAKNYRVIIPDLPGHGESEPKDGPLPISLMVSKLATVIGDQRVTLLGNSLGGWIAMLYTLAHPDKVERLILEASGGLSLPLDSPTTAHTREEAMVILRNVHGPRFEPQEWVIEALLQRAVSSPMLRVTEVAEHLVDARLQDIRVPTAVLWGADDGVVPRAYAEALHRGIAGSTMQVIEGAAHIPHLQQPERFLQCLTSIS
ncbi:MAG TPA: alpha/beta hydrolase [Thermoanaerobaculia bacterium]|nr:alpha/beta hydrolase [Thermoanaerobaculia bacterium]